jgi:hypothetical protein
MFFTKLFGFLLITVIIWVVQLAWTGNIEGQYFEPALISFLVLGLAFLVAFIKEEPRSI